METISDFTKRKTELKQTGGISQEMYLNSLSFMPKDSILYKCAVATMNFPKVSEEEIFGYLKSNMVSIASSIPVSEWNLYLAIGTKVQGNVRGHIIRSKGTDGDSCIIESDIAFINSNQNFLPRLRVTWKEVLLKNFTSVIPINCLLSIQAASGIFDYISIASIATLIRTRTSDVDGLSSIPDPVIFGRISGSTDRYYIDSWDNDIDISQFKAVGHTQN